MASRPPFRFDPLRLLQMLSRHEVEHVIVGGVAGRLRGSPLVTEDVDLVPHPPSATTTAGWPPPTPVFRQPIPRSAGSLS